MAYRGCKRCLTEPIIKCQKCKCKTCEEHSAPYGDRVGNKYRSPYRLCLECKEDFLSWMIETKFTRKSYHLCCLINPTLKCFLCMMGTCEKHFHEVQDCLIWAKWKRQPKTKKSNCCLEKRKEPCTFCSYPSCGGHKTIPTPYGKFATQCQLCGEQIGY